MKQFITLVFSILLSTSAFAQINVGRYKGYVATKNVENVDLKYINVTSIGNKLLLYTFDNGSKLNGRYRIIVSFITYYEAGFSNGLLTGTLEFYQHDMLRMKAEMRKGMNHGVTKKYETYGGKDYLANETVYNNDVKQREVSYYPDGNIRFTKEYDNKGVVKGDVKVYDPDGKVAEEKIQSNGKNIIRTRMNMGDTYTISESIDGYLVKENKYTSDGKQIKQCTYDEKGKPHGKWVEKYNNGQLFKIISYQHGSREGECLKYDEKGNLTYKGCYKNDKEDGVCENFYNGVITYRSTYKDGKLIHETRFEKGVICLDNVFSDGNLIVRKIYDPKGRLFSEQRRDENGNLKTYNKFNTEPVKNTAKVVKSSSKSPKKSSVKKEVTKTEPKKTKKVLKKGADGVIHVVYE